MIDFGKLDAILKARYMSRRKLADACGISVNTMSAWFRRRTQDIPIESICAIANTLHVVPRRIIRDEIIDLVEDDGK